MNVRDEFYGVMRTHGITPVLGNPRSNELPMLNKMPEGFRYVLAPSGHVPMVIVSGQQNRRHGAVNAVPTNVDAR